MCKQIYYLEYSLFHIVSISPNNLIGQVDLKIYKKGRGVVIKLMIYIFITSKLKLELLLFPELKSNRRKNTFIIGLISGGGVVGK